MNDARGRAHLNGLLIGPYLASRYVKILVKAMR